MLRKVNGLVVTVSTGVPGVGEDLHLSSPESRETVRQHIRDTLQMIFDARAALSEAEELCSAPMSFMEGGC